MAETNLVFLGIKGSVLALDKTTGRRVWEKKLKGYSFVSLLIENDRVFAGAQGEIFCLDAVTGETLWTDGLRGYGLDVMSIATANGRSDLSALAAEHASQQAAQNSNAGSATG